MLHACPDSSGLSGFFEAKKAVFRFWIFYKCPDGFFDPDISKKKMSGFQIRTNVRILECPDFLNFHRFYDIFFFEFKMSGRQKKCPDCPD